MMPGSRSAVGSFPVEQRRVPPAALVSAMVATTILVIDQSTKVMIRSILLPCTNGSCDTLHAGPFAIINQTNTGSAFGFHPGSPLWVLLAMVSVLLVPVYGSRLRSVADRTWILPIALGLVAGGALGNLTDRLLYGGATDFLVPGAYVTLNLADVAVLIGTAMTIAILLRNRARLRARRTS
jgi:signal peptidase II